ncbi:MAG: metal ABC transporter ATP-binding protein [Gammaproteobacteria bacterium]|nr:metal ABC transporter ATP-binding protein [Gammaproteobacteria bacterium]MDH5694439.1 metal ABC transporter ATP-binding protein [Gammaproteobacteria bacterium]
MSPNHIIELKDVSTGYKDNPVFTHLNLSLEQGLFAGIIGPTGSGKTTLLKTILGTLKPHGGEVLIMGKPVSSLSRGSVSYVPQLETVDWTFPVTVEQVIMMGLFTNRSYIPWPSREEKTKVAELAEKLGISAYLNQHIRNLSGGQQQRTFLARALISSPKLLVLDEPTSGVDIKTQHDVLHLLKHLNEDGISIIITTHDLNAVAAHLPWVICFNKHVIAAGKPQEVFTSKTLSETYGGDLDVIHHGSHVLIAHSHHHKH